MLLQEKQAAKPDRRQLKIQRKPPTPIGEIVLKAVGRRKVTIGDLVRSTAKSRGALRDALARLERDGWIKRGEYRQGCRRLIWKV